MMSNIPRPEHPNPQFERENWRNLNGVWEFEIDKSNVGEECGFVEQAHFSREILVPFCPESRLSGVGILDFMDAVWYKRRFDISAEELRGDVLLHFGAVDYECTVYVNGNRVGSHKGGYSSFEMDVTPYLAVGDNVLTVRAVDHTRSPLQPSGKQSESAHSHGCHYTRTTGIWQTVWLEFVPKKRLNFIRLTPNANACSVVIEAFPNSGGTLYAECRYEGKPMGSRRVELGQGGGSFELPLAEKHLWDIGQGRLYDLTLTFGEDRVSTYFGLRSIGFDGMKFLLNDRVVFQRLVLDQGFYPDGIYTAPSEEALRQDIKLSQAMGFNGARLHEKVFEPRFLYHCDREGYLVWGEYPNWGVDISRPDALHVVMEEWLETLRRDGNHPAIIGWCPFNETWDYAGRKQYDQTLSAVYHLTKAVDPTRPCIDTSGAYHVVTDVFCVHDYEQNPAIFKARYDRLMTEGTLTEPQSHRQTYRGEPVFLSEYGGTGWPTGIYGDAPKTKADFLARFEGLTTALLQNDRMFGLCYTQLYDLEQEINGLYTYDRQAKFPPETIAAILTRPAAIEQQP
mgnify:CR=1 FL=1